MAVEGIRYMDQQGRVIIPPHIREALNLGPGKVVKIDLAEDGTITIRPTEERCAICGEAVEGHHLKMGKKLICSDCAHRIAKVMLGKTLVKKREGDKE